MSRAWKSTWSLSPGIGVSLLPTLACPLCWPAYAGLLSSLGLGFLISTKYLFPLTVVFLAVALGPSRSEQSIVTDSGHLCSD